MTWVACYLVGFVNEHVEQRLVLPLIGGLHDLAHRRSVRTIRKLDHRMSKRKSVGDAMVQA